MRKRSHFYWIMLLFWSILFVVNIAIGYADSSGLMLYHTKKTGSSSEYINSLGITLESDRFSVISEDPEKNIASIVNWCSSQSWAKAYIVPYTCDGRLYTLRGAGTGGFSVNEYDPTTLVQIGSTINIYNANLLSYTSVINAVKVTSTRIYYKNTDSDWYVYNRNTTTSQKLNSSCYNYLAEEGRLFCANPCDYQGVTSSNGPLIHIQEMNPDTGSVIHDVGWFNFGTIDGGYWHFAVSDKTVFAFRSTTTTRVHEVWSLDMDAPTTFYRIFYENLSAALTFNFDQIDADNGMFLLADNEGEKVLLFNTSSSSWDMIARPYGYSCMQILVSSNNSPDIRMKICPAINLLLLSE